MRDVQPHSRCHPDGSRDPAWDGGPQLYGGGGGRPGWAPTCVGEAGERLGEQWRGFWACRCAGSPWGVRLVDLRCRRGSAPARVVRMSLVRPSLAGTTGRCKPMGQGPGLSWDAPPPQNLRSRRLRPCHPRLKPARQVLGPLEGTGAKGYGPPPMASN